MQLKNKTNHDFHSKHQFARSKKAAEKSVTTYLWSEVDLLYCERLFMNQDAKIAKFHM